MNRNYDLPTPIIDGKEAEAAEPEASQVICFLLLSIKIGAPSSVGDAPFIFF